MLTTLVLVAAVMVLLLNMDGLYGSGVCPDCGGRRKHSDDCWRS